MNTLVFLTREGCSRTDNMRASLDEALKAINQPRLYRIVDLARLKADDPRRGYPTPTLLSGGRDVFDMPEPQPPFPEPT